MTTTELPAGVQDAMLRLARQLARHNLDIDDLANESGLAFSSVEAGDDSFDLYDDDGNLKMSVGFDGDDGRFRVKHHNTVPPPKPESPDTVSVNAGVMVVYDGTFADDEAAPSDLSYYEVHASPTSGFTADDTTLVGSITSVDGGTFIHGSTDTFSTYYYAIVAVDLAGNESIKSEETSGVVGGIHGHQKLHIAASPTDLTMRFRFLPLGDSSVHLYWNGVLQEDDAWSLVDRDLTILDPDGLAKAGDRFFAKYLYVDPSFEPASLVLVASTHAVGGISSIALPSATEPGDLLVLVSCQRNTAAHITSTDYRLTVIHDDTYTATTPSATGLIGYGVADASGTPVDIHTLGGVAGAWTELSVFRVTGEVHDRGFTAFHARGGSGVAPVMPLPEDAMGIVAMMGIYNIVADTFDDDSMGNWTTVSPGVDSGGSTLIAYCTTGTPGGLWPGMSSTAEVAWLVIGVTEET